MVINRVAPLSAAKVAGTLYAGLGLLFGVIFSLVALAGGMGTGFDEPGAAAVGMIFGAGAVVVLPILYGGLAFVMTLLVAALYNFIAQAVGGIEIDVS